MPFSEGDALPVLTLCADDFGLNLAVNEAIIALVQQGRLNAVSAMAVGEEFEAGAEELLIACNRAPLRVEIGLHLTLTEYAPLGVMPNLAPAGTLPSVNTLLLKSHARFLALQELRDEIYRQWRRFIKVIGRRPDFIDGHQHVHLLPQIREIVADLAQHELPRHGWVRSCHASGAKLRARGLFSAKVALISHLSKTMRGRLERAGIKTNAHFYGVNDFKRTQDFARLMQGWLSLAAQDDGWVVIMCHPGMVPREGAVHDPIAERRVDEFEYLASSNLKII